MGLRSSLIRESSFIKERVAITLAILSFPLVACGGSTSSDELISDHQSEQPVPPSLDIGNPTDAEIAEQFGLDPSKPPSENFDLLGWYLNTPRTDPESEDETPKPIRIDEVDLANGFVDDDYFWTADDGGMVFRVTNAGATTSANTQFTRTELRGMLRRGDDDIDTRTSDGTPNLNNWVFSSAPDSAKDLAGGVDGTLRATLAINATTTTGSEDLVGQFIVGQIHASNDEPIRLYYRKLPQNERGSIYAAHEINGADDIYYEIVGSRSDDAENPTAGPALNEIWSYEIIAAGDSLTAVIYRGDLEGVELGRAEIDMSESGYGIEKEFMYFKAGAYNQNNTRDGGAPDDFAQATFYVLEASHD